MTEPIILSREERALFNPAFMALVTCRVVQGHQRDEGSCPLPIAVTAAVMALQPAIRELLPATTRTSLPKWVHA
ncbi:three component ABC system middle component, partial [Streptomyces sp. NPDC004290]